MSETDLKQLRAFCDEFKRLRTEKADGKGGSLNDILNTYNYVRKQVNGYGLTETIFGSELDKQLGNVSEVIVQLKNCLENLEKSLDGFCEMQSKNNG